VVQDKDESLHARTLQVKELQKVRPRPLHFFYVGMMGVRIAGRDLLSAVGPWQTVPEKEAYSQAQS